MYSGHEYRFSSTQPSATLAGSTPWGTVTANLEYTQKTGLCLTFWLVCSCSLLERFPSSFCPFVICAKASCTTRRKKNRSACFALGWRQQNAVLLLFVWVRVVVCGVCFGLVLGPFPHQKTSSSQKRILHFPEMHTLTPDGLLLARIRCRGLFRFWLSLNSWGQSTRSACLWGRRPSYWRWCF